MNVIAGNELTDSPVRFTGALGFDRTKTGLSPRRLPEWTRSQIPPPMELMVRMTSGVCLTFVTDSPSIVLRAMTTSRTFLGRPDPEVGYELVVNKEHHYQRDSGGNRIVMERLGSPNFELHEGNVTEISFPDLGDNEKEIELWFPANAIVEIESLQLEEGADLYQPRTKRASWLHYGSSISHGASAARPTQTWPAVAATARAWELWNLGFGGHCHLDQFVARSIRDLNPDLISIKVGVNVVNLDSMRERVFTPALHGFLDTIRERCTNTPIVLASPIYMPGGETEPGPHSPDRDGQWVAFRGHEEVQRGCLNLVRIREVIKALVEQRTAEGDTNLHYVDGLQLLGPDEAKLLPDGLHPNTKGLRRIGERFAELAFC